MLFVESINIFFQVAGSIGVGATLYRGADRAALIHFAAIRKKGFRGWVETDGWPNAHGHSNPWGRMGMDESQFFSKNQLEFHK